MKKPLFIALSIAFMFIIPVSVYAYSSINPSTTTPPNVSSNDDTRFSSPMMGNYDFMSQMMGGYGNGMMNGLNALCDDPEQHELYIQEQKGIIEQKLQSGEITEAQANDYLINLDQMLQFHEQYHNKDFTSTNCH